MTRRLYSTAISRRFVQENKPEPFIPLLFHRRVHPHVKSHEVDDAPEHVAHVGFIGPKHTQLLVLTNKTSPDSNLNNNEKIGAQNLRDNFLLSQNLRSELLISSEASPKMPPTPSGACDHVLARAMRMIVFGMERNMLVPAY